MLATTNPLITQGTLNRLVGSIQFVDFPKLNVTASYLGKEGIGLRRMTDAMEFIDTMTGGVTSPAPYQKFELTIHLLRTQNVASLFEQQLLTNTVIGNLVVRTDAVIHPPYPLTNCGLMTVDPYKIDGTDPSYNIMIVGYYYINNALWQ